MLGSQKCSLCCCYSPELFSSATLSWELELASQSLVVGQPWVTQSFSQGHRFDLSSYRDMIIRRLVVAYANTFTVPPVFPPLGTFSLYKTSAEYAKTLNIQVEGGLGDEVVYFLSEGSLPELDYSTTQSLSGSTSYSIDASQEFTFSDSKYEILLEIKKAYVDYRCGNEPTQESADRKCYTAQVYMWTSTAMHLINNRPPGFNPRMADNGVAVASTNTALLNFGSEPTAGQAPHLCLKDAKNKNNFSQPFEFRNYMHYNLTAYALSGSTLANSPQFYGVGSLSFTVDDPAD